MAFVDVEYGSGGGVQISEAVSLYTGSSLKDQPLQITLTESCQALLIATSDARNNNTILEYDGINITAFFCQISSSNQTGCIVAFGNFVSGKTLTITTRGGGTTNFSIVGLK